MLVTLVLFNLLRLLRLLRHRCFLLNGSSVATFVDVTSSFSAVAFVVGFGDQRFSAL